MQEKGGGSRGEVVEFVFDCADAAGLLELSVGQAGFGLFGGHAGACKLVGAVGVERACRQPGFGILRRVIRVDPRLHEIRGQDERVANHVRTGVLSGEVGLDPLHESVDEEVDQQILRVPIDVGDEGRGMFGGEPYPGVDVFSVAVTVDDCFDEFALVNCHGTYRNRNLK